MKTFALALGGGGARGLAHIAVLEALDDMGTRPAAIARLTATDARVGGHSAQGGPVEAAAVANLCVFDPAATTVVDPERLASRSRNTPYAGRTFSGAVRHTVLRGEPVVIDAVAQR